MLLLAVECMGSQLLTTWLKLNLQSLCLKGNLNFTHRFTIGHENGSSHGPSRITRSVYESEFYRDMNTLALQKYWPEM